MKNTNTQTNYLRRVTGVVLLASVLILSACNDKKSSRNTGQSSGAYQQCSSCPIQTDTLARAWGQANDQYRKLEMGLHFYVDLSKYSDLERYTNASGQYLGNFQGEQVWAEGYLFVDRDSSGYCSLAQGLYNVQTVTPAQLDNQSFYTSYGSGTGVTGLRLIAIHQETQETVELNWDNAQFSTLNPYVISPIDNVEYPNGLEATVNIIRITGPNIACTPNPY